MSERRRKLLGDVSNVHNLNGAERLSISSDEGEYRGENVGGVYGLRPNEVKIFHINSYKHHTKQFTMTFMLCVKYF